MVRIGWTPAANQAGMSCDVFNMLSIADSTRLRMGRTAFFDPLDGEVPVHFALSAQATLRSARPLDPKGDGRGSAVVDPKF